MDGQQIEFVIRPDGTVEEKVSGAQGPGCEAMTQAIEKALGTVADRTRTADYYESRNEQTGDSQTINA